jgi:hypothetical protein
VSTKRNSPYFSIKGKVKLPYFPQCVSEFQGKDAPPCIIYNPEMELIKRRDISFTVGKSPRFHQFQDEV